jgi:hypothetical protein
MPGHPSHRGFADFCLFYARQFRMIRKAEEPVSDPKMKQGLVAFGALRSTTTLVGMVTAEQVAVPARSFGIART